MESLVEMPSLQLRKQLTRKVLREGGKAFLSLFDLEKAFDTIERQYYCNVSTKKASVAEHGGLSRVGTLVQWQG